MTATRIDRGSTDTTAIYSDGGDLVFERTFDAPIERVGSKFTPLPFAPVMEQYVVPHSFDVLDAVRRTVGRG